MPMNQTRRGAAATAAGAVLLIALATAGCGRPGRVGDGTAAPATPAASIPIAAQASPDAASTQAEAPSDPTPPASTDPTPPASTDPTPPAATVTPVPTPDLAGIQDLLDQLGRDLDADASATTSEGSPQ
jgi:hypothetical protein